ncbi:hypothetical protein HFO56_01310 [Rhizobium laguerreae]|uniref:hypothetical protein n=1 Tax=Rhizobium laguerreae TaxID=1076926 RepID=UPI001C92A034|nr:hypothetical protein [Rhizobium laguerreae]MBY3151048.1 hypothetical protein [Rhizobium laguerreae]
MASASEKVIREAVVARCREHWPEGRIIHELAIGGCRADLAVVTKTHVFAFEIKSDRDTLSRLASQFNVFHGCTHGCFVVAHERWFEQFTYNNGSPGFRPGELLNEYDHRALGLWAFPESPHGDWQTERYRWRKPGRDYRFDQYSQPRAASLLGILLREELVLEARRHGVPFKSRWPVTPIISAMAYGMTGREVSEAVCRQLRARTFAAADAPIFEGTGA